VSSVPWWEVGLAIGIGAVTIAIFIWIASRIYRTGLLMYGKRPTLREVARWVRRSA
jgi:ABC-2 type transport system permease protein